MIDERGRDLSVTDGVWIIRLGQFGWVGYICYFGLVTAPVIFLRRRRSEVPAETLGLATIVSANLVYLIPNATLGPVAWTFSGALAGYLQYGQADEGAKSEVPASREMTYSRFPAPTDKSAYRRHFKGDA